MPHIDPHALAGTWLHSFEEDEGAREVYRPADFAFPPARRAREGLTLAADGVAHLLGPGPDDRPARVATTRWHLDGDQVTVETARRSSAATFRVSAMGDSTFCLVKETDGSGSTHH